MNKSQENLECVASVKQLRSMEQAGEITCSECLTGALLELFGITGREVAVQMGE